MLRQTISNIIVPRHALVHARHICGVPRHLMNRCTKYGAIDLFTVDCWHGAVPCHFNESSNVFVSFSRVISQFFLRNSAFEIIDYFKCCSNGSSRPQLNRMLEFSLNRPTTSVHPYWYKLITHKDKFAHTHSIDYLKDWQRAINYITDH